MPQAGGKIVRPALSGLPFTLLLKLLPEESKLLGLPEVICLHLEEPLKPCSFILFDTICWWGLGVETGSPPPTPSLPLFLLGTHLASLSTQQAAIWTARPSGGLVPVWLGSEPWSWAPTPGQVAGQGSLSAGNSCSWQLGLTDQPLSLVACLFPNPGRESISVSFSLWRTSAASDRKTWKEFIIS